MRRYLLTFTIVFLIAWPLAAPVANGAAAIAYITKEFGLDVVARLLARTFLNQLSNNVIKTINTLGDGSGTKGPTFIQDWKKFLGEAESMGLNQFRAQVSQPPPSLKSFSNSSLTALGTVHLRAVW